MTDNNGERYLQGLVLLERPLTHVADAIDVLSPGTADPLREADLASFTLNVGDSIATITVVPEPLVGDDLDYAVKQSLQNARVAAAQQRHAGYLVVSVPASPNVLVASSILSNLLARFADDDNGLAVWLPYAELATTDVIYAGEVEQRPTQTWFNTMAARIDETTSLAHSIGLTSLGSPEIQLQTAALDPAGAYQGLRGGVADLIDAGVLPKPGGTITIAGVEHTLTAGESLIGFGEVLEAVPTAAETPKKKGWFGRG